MELLTSEAGARGKFLEKTRTEAFAQRDKARNATTPVLDPTLRSAVRSENADIPKPPFWGARTIEGMDLTELWPCFDLKSLYRLSWGASNTKGGAFDELVKTDFGPRLARYQARTMEGGLLYPKVAYGYFPAAGTGNDVIVYDPNDASKEITIRVRAPDRRRASIACGLRARTRERARMGVSRCRLSPSAAGGEQTEKLQEEQRLQ